MEKLKALMSRKVAGIPVVALAALLMGALLYAAFKMKSTPDTEEPTDASATDTDTEQSAGDGTDANEQPAFIVPGSRLNTGGIDTGTVPEVPGMAVPTTNDLWKSEVQTWLVGQGVAPVKAAAVVSNYFNGVSMSGEDSALLNKAIVKFGFPPEGAPDYVSLPSAPTPEGPTPPAPNLEATQVAYAKNHGGKQFSGSSGKHFVQGSKDNTFAELARLYYGDANGAIRIKIASYNAGYREPFPAHRVVYIPPYVSPRWYKVPKTGRTDVKYIAGKNGTTEDALRKLNPGFHWPARRGARVRVR